MQCMCAQPSKYAFRYPFTVRFTHKPGLKPCVHPRPERFASRTFQNNEPCNND